MKTLRSLALTAVLAVTSLSAFAADKAPNLPIDQALKIAQDYLQKSGNPSGVQIVGLTYEQASLRSSFWYAKWSSSVDVDGSRKETGLRIDMDGTITRFVTGPGGGHEPPPGQRPVGARSMR
ncbi:MAG TPA: hypothetical protein VK961_05145 [Chthoniobacter sp.]|nr:hypothetical protein [Chthoniobacter sp.]